MALIQQFSLGKNESKRIWMMLKNNAHQELNLIIEITFYFSVMKIRSTLLAVINDGFSIIALATKYIKIKSTIPS